MRSNEPNSMKIDYWDEIYPDDKIYIRPEDGKKFSIVDGIYYAVHPIYILFAASEDGIIINLKHGSSISCRLSIDICIIDYKHKNVSGFRNTSRDSEMSSFLAATI